MSQKFDAILATGPQLNTLFQKNVPFWRQRSVTGVFHIWTLHEKAAAHGLASSEYLEARKALQTSLLKLRNTKGETTIVLSPYVHGSTPQQSSSFPRIKRAEGALEGAAASFSPAATSFPKTTIPSCYISETACNSATASCSGHGKCTLTWTTQASDDEEGSECWSCWCSATVQNVGSADNVKNKTTYWGGPACQKKDVSVPFWLFTFLGVCLATGISYGVGLLYSMGEADLPSVLGAGVSSVGARGK